MNDRSDDTHTADGVEITPGLWVWNNNLDSVQVDPKQFATDEDRARLFRRANPAATVYSEVWYDMLNGEGQRSSIMNGTRMATVYDGIKAADHPGKSIRDVRAEAEAAKLEAAKFHARFVIDVYIPTSACDGDREVVLAMLRDYFDPRFRRPLPDSAVVTTNLPEVALPSSED